MKNMAKFLITVCLFLGISFVAIGQNTGRPVIPDHTNYPPPYDKIMLDAIRQREEFERELLVAHLPKETLKAGLPSFLQKVNVKIYEFKHSSTFTGHPLYYWSLFIPKDSFDGILSPEFFLRIGLLDWAEECGIDIVTKPVSSYSNLALDIFDGHRIHLVKGMYHVRIEAFHISGNNYGWTLKLYDGEPSHFNYHEGYYFTQRIK